MKVLVTGGAGYIGSHTAKLLAHAGIEPVVLDDLSTGHRDAVRWGPFVEGNIGDPDLVKTVLRDHQIQSIIHFAASAYVGESMQNPRKYFQNNVVNALALLDAAVESGIRHIVFSSSCATYGMAEESAINEDHAQRPINPYGDSKLFFEKALRWYGEAYGLQWIALRYFNAAGADADGELGEAHNPETHLIPLVIQTALQQRAYLDIFGTDYDTPDGTAVRDYIHVSDLASAHLLGLQHLLDGGDSVALNLGTSHGHSVREVVHAVEQASGRPVRVQESPRRLGDPPTLVADAARAARTIRWEPEHSSLETIVESAWQWFAPRSTLAERLS